MSHAFKPFSQDPSVCDTCGELVESHVVKNAMEGFNADAWTVMLKYGGIWNRYSESLHGYDTYVLRDHFGIHVLESTWRQLWKYGNPIKRAEKACEINWNLTTAPQFDGQAASNFCGTNAEDQPVSGVAGSLTCKCEEYVYEHVVLPNKTMGQLIWLIAREGDKK